MSTGSILWNRTMYRLCDDSQWEAKRPYLYHSGRKKMVIETQQGFGKRGTKE